ncbi:MAG: TetR/AcrR family transcriptional regulator [Schleiferiaceae bacterium]|jgi:AcrR family transcriptional regulator|nr:TetR/AcrR family transcriptional regulator [Schleiferiaceae bacterium]
MKVQKKIAYNKSQQAIIEAARTLFWKYGVKKVSVEEIAKEAGVSKMTFYRGFKNKIDIVNSLLVQISEKGMQDYKAIMNSNMSFTEKVNSMILIKHQNSEGVSEEFIRDVFGVEQEVWQKTISEYQTAMHKELYNDFAKAQKEGWIRQDMSLDFVFYMLEDMQAKVRDAKFLALHNGDLHASIMEITKFFFYGVIPEKDHQK